MNHYYQEVVNLLKDLIQTPSFSKDEEQTAHHIETFLKKYEVNTFKQGYNIWAANKHFSPEKITILLNSHHDTVKPVDGWTYDPFKATVEDDKLIGLGSNDAGGPLVSLMATFLHFYAEEGLPFNLIFAATAEEEISGKHGIASIIEHLGKIDLAIVGEPTSLNMAIAEKGLMVIDGIAEGQSGHAAREEGINALYIALEDIDWIRKHRFEKTSDLLGPVKMSVTQIEAGYQHNVVPDKCTFVIDVRSNECYSNVELHQILEENCQSTLTARSYRLNSSGIDPKHAIVKTGIAMGMNTYGSPTLSDQALMPFPSIKLGCGDSARSHTADEYILLSEIEAGINTYIQLLKQTDWKLSD
ncbi:MAG: M20 family metallo-hydrolase [Bacteroidota bacterium]